ncbi:MAG TPA: acyl carrier protein [Vicinamibacterales bacterium]|nr:acyl carrier protein [Vicinamibacterales bacterium]
MTPTDAVLAFFDTKGGVPGASRAEQLSCAYLDQKVIDSMGIIEMVAHLEDTLGVRFDAEDLQSNEFQTVGGLIAIIERLQTVR